MEWVDTLTGEIEKVFGTKWDTRNGTLIPESEDLALKDGAVKIDATFLYADLAGSSKLAEVCPWETTAKIIRAYLDCCTRSIRAHKGEIRSFDGDRVMGVFKSESKNTDAAKCAREIDWMVEKIIDPKAKEYFKSIRENSISIRHSIGIDTGEAIAVRAGIRNNNDLIWIGKAPSFAAKLSDIRKHPYCVYISKDSYDSLHQYGKIINGENIWQLEKFMFAGKTYDVYRTSIMSKP